MPDNIVNTLPARFAIPFGPPPGSVSSGPSVDVFGGLLAYLQEERWEFDPTRGYTHFLDFKGANMLLLADMQASYAQQGMSSTLSNKQGGTATLNVQDATMANTIDVWEIPGEAEEMDAFTHPIYETNFTDDQIAAARGIVTQFESGVLQSTILAAVQANPQLSSANDDNKALISEGIAKVLRGATTYRRERYSLRHTTNVSNRSSWNVADYNIGKNYSINALLTEITNANLWAFPAPNRIVSKLQFVTNYAASTTPYHPGYAWGWLKGASQERTAANNRVDIVTEYVMEEWPVEWYPLFGQ
jgi:hypothetical protein